MYKLITIVEPFKQSLLLFQRQIFIICFISFLLYLKRKNYTFCVRLGGVYKIVYAIFTTIRRIHESGEGRNRRIKCVLCKIKNYLVFVRFPPALNHLTYFTVTLCSCKQIGLSECILSFRITVFRIILQSRMNYVEYGFKHRLARHTF